ncbi:TPA: hypothetical protein NJJ38_003132 [Pseudomonas aeruginosa]|uniref:Uncharacterized protein n=2 Tax=Pseudomonas aeruginosa TaxID=287 RepID=A0A241XEQ3_PSEAI|nr:hypothetical protein [Pseudomonas aeruginosa]AMA38088.1 hypothetical protein DPADHS01_19150 [Pseudomonas aeruginosa DHS01]AWE86075.1 hypothetical protein CSC29_3130 [Pseudomonas aeruginosa]AWR42855.1 hypothetical protein CLH63_08910 [Pseudomonas aeruginosa]EIU5018533.1 hypothetical protein [Pseudomonas aeruginosa]EIZ7656559.1 hypothetical protein [Pseudomonas aeruginosa]
MNGREMLELAAKAAGYRIHWYFNGDEGIEVSEKNGPRLTWNPLLNNGDAFGLALRIPHLNLQWLIAEAFQAHPDDLEAREQYARLMIVEFAGKLERSEA